MSRVGAIPAEDVLGDNYNITNISVSNYNPSIDGTVTVTVTVKDVYGDAVSGETVLVTASAGNFTKYNGSTITSASSYTGTTNSSGQFTLTYTCSEWGIINFSANNTSKQIKTSGWKEVSVTGATSYASLYVNGSERIAYFRYYRSGYNFTSTSTVTLHSGAIPSSYRPGRNVNCSVLNSTIVGGLNTDGDISVISSSTGSKTINMTVMWYY